MTLYYEVNGQWVECGPIEHAPRTLVLGTTADHSFSRHHRVELGPDAEHGSTGLCFHGQRPGLCGSCVTVPVKVGTELREAA